MSDSGLEPLLWAAGAVVAAAYVLRHRSAHTGADATGIGIDGGTRFGTHLGHAAGPWSHFAPVTWPNGRVAWSPDAVGAALCYGTPMQDEDGPVM